MGLKVKLTEEEINLAYEIAQKRNQSQRKSNRRDGNVLADSLEIDKQGAAAEMAVAKALGRAWDGKFFEIGEWYKWREVGNDVSGLEIRSTKHKNGRLILHPRDKDYAPFILVVQNKDDFELVGWLYAFEGKKQEYWKDVGYGRPCYYAPQEILRDITTIPVKVK